MEISVMTFEIIGSGGCVSLPKPLCTCKVCVEAREKGRPYSRFGCALFLHNINLLVDTPEDIAHALNSSGVKEVERVLYSHADPDHALGFRVFEQLRLNWFDISEGKTCLNPIQVYALPEVMNDLNSIQSKFGPYMDYYDQVRNLIARNIVEKEVSFGKIQVSIYPVGSASVFLFESGGKKVLYAPCDVKPFPDQEVFHGADLLIIGNTVVGEKLKNNYVLGPDNFMKTDLFSMEEIVDIKSKYAIKDVIITHLEEDWGKSYDDYKALEIQFENIRFAYDGMIIEV